MKDMFEKMVEMGLFPDRIAAKASLFHYLHSRPAASVRFDLSTDPRTTGGSSWLRLRELLQGGGDL